VRAVFSENVEDTLRVAEERRSSPDLTHLHTVKAGEHLTLLADKYYGDASRYLQVADYNKLANFRRLEPGQQLVFPPLLEVTR
jgi:nucleoid-associated protein YgaU